MIFTKHKDPSRGETRRSLCSRVQMHSISCGWKSLGLGPTLSIRHGGGEQPLFLDRKRPKTATHLTHKHTQRAATSVRGHPTVTQRHFFYYQLVNKGVCCTRKCLKKCAKEREETRKTVTLHLCVSLSLNGAKDLIFFSLNYPVKSQPHSLADKVFLNINLNTCAKMKK